MSDCGRSPDPTCSCPVCVTYRVAPLPWDDEDEALADGGIREQETEIASLRSALAAEREAHAATRGRSDEECEARNREIVKLRAALAKIDAIRNSIVGRQKIHWSMHIYPLVAALGEAGFEGDGYEVAQAKAQAEVAGLEAIFNAETAEAQQERDAAIARAERAERERDAMHVQRDAAIDDLVSVRDGAARVSDRLDASHQACVDLRADLATERAACAAMRETLAAMVAEPLPTSTEAKVYVGLRTREAARIALADSGAGASLLAELRALRAVRDAALMLLGDGVPWIDPDMRCGFCRGDPPTPQPGNERCDKCALRAALDDAKEDTL